MSPEEDRTRDAVDSELKHYQRAIPPPWWLIKAFAPRAEGPGFDFRLRRGDFSGSSHTSDLKIGAPVGILPCAWRYRVSAGTGWPGVSIL